MPEICQKYARIMLEICQKYARIMPEICQKYARNMPELCQKYVRSMTGYASNMPEICQTYARNMIELCQNMPELCQKYASNMPELCQKSARIVSELCQTYARNMPEICQKLLLLLFLCPFQVSVLDMLARQSLMAALRLSHYTYQADRTDILANMPSISFPLDDCVCTRREYLLWLISNMCSQLFHKESCASTRRENSRSLWLIARGALVCSQCPANSAPLQMIPSHISVT